MRITEDMIPYELGTFDGDQLLTVATAIAQGFVSNPSIDWESKKVARTAVQFAKDLIHEVEQEKET